MRFVIARLNHETNTFSPVPTPLEAFEPRWGRDAFEAASGTRTAMGAFLELAAELGAEVVTPVLAWANPSGPVDDAAYERITGSIVEAVRQGCDAVLLDLHGALVTASRPDGEGELLERVRAAAPGVPITVALDLHGNVTERMVENADILVSFKTYPHVDMYEAGALAGRLLARTLAGEVRPVVAWRRPPLMTHTLRSATDEGAMHRAVEAAREAEREGLLAVSVFAGFSLADIPAPCLSIVAVADGDRERAEACVERIARQAWDEREAFVYRSEPLQDSMRRARELANAPGAGQRPGQGAGPVLLLDHGDNCMSGGTCDDMEVLRAALECGLDDILVGPICDPQAVAQLFAAGRGARALVQVGNKRELDKLGIAKSPLALEGTVRSLSDGRFVVTGPTYTGQAMDMGRTAVFDIGAARLVLTERIQEPLDVGVFECVGEDPRAARYLLLKSRMYCRPVFVPMSRAVVECDGRGVTSSDYSLFPFSEIERPVYPLDEEIRWEATR